MKPDRWKEVERIFNRATELEGEARARYLDEACAADPRLRADIEGLLDFDDPTTSYVDVSPLRGTRSDGDGRHPIPGIDRFVGTSVGPYRLLERVGEGGMGVIYRARREDDLLNYFVAVKLVRHDLDNEQILRQFQNERQMLAGLDHPHIARLLDGGATDEGLPYLVMEYVDGEPLDEYCDKRHLTIAERLALFCTVCDTVHYAHQHLVVHRDLKPSNVLVTADGHPKLLDFGIARLLDEQSRPVAERTATIARMLTPDFASPEQIRGEPVTTATDIYSLAVILYRLLTGQRPYRLTTAGIDEIQRAVCEQDPTRPSTALLRPEAANAGLAGASASASDTAAVRGTGIERLRRELRGDLDNIVMMALRKEPARRYASAEQFAGDIRRCLDGHPVLAQGHDSLPHEQVRASQPARRRIDDGRLPRAGRGSRHRAPHGRRRRDRTRRRAGRRDARGPRGGARTDRSRFRRRDGGDARPDAAAGRGRRRRTEPAARRSRVRARPHPPAVCRSTTPRGKPDRRRRTGADEPERVRAGRGADERGDGAAARRIRNGGPRDRAEPVESWRAPLRERRVRGRGGALRGRTRPPPAAPRGRAHGRRPGGEQPGRRPSRTRATRRVGGASPRSARPSPGTERRQRSRRCREPQQHRGHPHRAGGLRRRGGGPSEALAIRTKVLGSHHPHTAQTRANLAVTLHQAGDLDGAETLYREALAAQRAMPGADDTGLGKTLTTLADLLRAKGELGESAAMLDEALGIQQGQFGPNHLEIAVVRSQIARLEYARGNHEAARRQWDEVLRIRRLSLPQDHILIGSALKDYGTMLVSLGELETAEDALREAVRIYRASLPPEHWHHAVVSAALAECLTEQDRFDEAESLLEQAHDVLRGARGEEAAETQRAAQLLARVAERRGG